jgi:cyclopropane fatty-acyl-phospholipid synthase-like methyltransferase
MAREGMDVIGVEGQDSNYRKCKAIEQYFGLPNLKFLHADVKEISRQSLGTFDVILCCGILYHLDNPFSFIKKLHEMCTDFGMMFLDTHLAPDRTSLKACRFRESLSDIETFEYDARVYNGRWFHEFDEGSLKEADVWAAVSSFKHILEVFGTFEIEEEYELKTEYSRSYFLVKKESQLLKVSG